MKKILLMPLCALMACSGSLWSQCSVNVSATTTITAGSGFTWGQTFTATCTGVLDTIGFIPAVNDTCSGGTLNIYNGQSVTGSIYSQSYTAMPVMMGVPMRIALTNPVPVTNGQQYTFEYFVDVNVFGEFSDIYAGGVPWQNGSSVPTAELAFRVHISSGVGFGEYSLEGVSVYPNPSSDVFNLDFGKNDFSGTVELFSMDGRLVLSEKANGQKHQVNMNNLAKGIYIIKVRSEDRIATFKVVCQ